MIQTLKKDIIYHILRTVYYLEFSKSRQTELGKGQNQ
jgi:hypothetical protein